ncbi:MAG: glycosyltransferase family 2 protein [Candidatus Sulfotelmatobacter sp.]|jgi:glycosyltransferase involved in cell wall biosynthesis
MRGDVEVEDISVILCTYNRASSLKSTLESFSGLTLPPDLDWELIVVDNNSKDNTQEVIRDFAKTARFSVRYIFERRQGRSPALNAGIAAAKGAIVAFTDDDVILHPEWLLNLKRAFDEFDCAGVGGRVVPVWHHPKPDWLEMEEQQAIVNFELGEVAREIKDRTPLGANSAYRKDKFEKYGVFRLDLGVSGENRGITCEDSEFASRLFRAGEKIRYAPHAIIYHPVDPVRSSKAYFRKWYYNDGRSMIRAWPPPKNVVRYFGIPRWIFRSVVENFLKWTFNFDAKRRFHCKLRTYRDVGRLVESYRNRCVI